MAEREEAQLKREEAKYQRKLRDSFRTDPKPVNPHAKNKADELIRYFQAHEQPSWQWGHHGRPKGLEDRYVMGQWGSPDFVRDEDYEAFKWCQEMLVRKLPFSFRPRLPPSHTKSSDFSKNILSSHSYATRERGG